MKEYYFCFCNSRRKWLKLLKKGFQHCFVAIRYGNVFFVMEDSLEGFYPSIMLAEDFFLFTNLNKCSILTMERVEPKSKKFGIWYWAPTCVNFVKTVGSFRTKAQTPYQLYKYLLKKGAKQWVDTQDKLQDNKPLKRQKPELQSNKQNLKKKKRLLSKTQKN